MNTGRKAPKSENAVQPKQNIKLYVNSSGILQLPSQPFLNPYFLTNMHLTQQQKSLRTISQQCELLHMQQQLIVLLKQEIRMLQNKHGNMGESSPLQKQLGRRSEEVRLLKTELVKTRQNNESLIQTFQAYKQILKERVEDQNSNIMNNQDKKSEVLKKSDSGIFDTIMQKFRLQDDKGKPQKILELSKDLPQAGMFSTHYQLEFADEDNARFWQTEILKDIRSQTSVVKNRQKLKSLLSKRFYPENLRHIFWPMLIQDQLHLSQKLFYTLLERVNRQPKVTIVTVDLKRLNVGLPPEQATQMLSQIQSCLYVFMACRPDIGYVQGMPYFMWMLMVRMPMYEAWVCFTNLIVRDKLLFHLFSFNHDKISSILRIFQINLKNRRPKLAKHLDEHRITPDMYLVEWGYTMFSRAFSLNIASKIWDMWLAQGNHVFFKTALAILQLAENEILSLEYEDTLIKFKAVTKKLEENQLLKTIRKQKLLYQDIISQL